MIIITNRNLQPKASAVERFGEKINEKGPNELRLAEARYVHGQWQVDIIDNQISHNGEKIFGSEYAFLKVLNLARTKKQNALFFVHGFNNDFKAVLERAIQFEKNFGVTVGVFSWPANGGGVKGVASYKNDKRDALASVVALDRTFEKLSHYLGKYAGPDCPFSFNLALHSMGNYLFKNLLKSSVYNGETLLFDNISMIAADVNNYGHAEWMNRIQFRKRLFVTINENDIALRASRLKFGENQHARLGHVVRNLAADNAAYVDFTDAKKVGSSHAYFEGDSLKNKNIRAFFSNAFNGQFAEKDLSYNAPTHTFVLG